VGDASAASFPIGPIVGGWLLDLGGAVASSLGLAGVTYGFIEAGEEDWGDPVALAALAAGAAVLAGVAVARQLDSAPLLDLVRGAFVHDMDAMLLVCGIVTAVGVVLAVLLLPARPEPVVGPVGARAESEHEINA
jgi:hypothetical protein